MSITRLDQFWPEGATILRQLDPHERRSKILEVVAMVSRSVSLLDERALKVQRALNDRRSILPPDLLRLDQLVTQLDQTAWAIAANEQSDPLDYLAAFGQARSAAAIRFAAEQQLASDLEAVYESMKAREDDTPIRMLVDPMAKE